jgi:hypothetical protein
MKTTTDISRTEYNNHLSANDFSKSTATKAQHLRILAMLRVGTKSTFDFRKAGVLNPSMRINELNATGAVQIDRIALRSVIDQDGFLHPRIAFYSLTKDLSEVNHEA